MKHEDWGRLKTLLSLKQKICLRLTERTASPFITADPIGDSPCFTQNVLPWFSVSVG
jgi:hypothetical protein